jgi:hypothetical protein
MLTQLIIEEVGIGNIVMMEDSLNDSFVAIGEILALDFIPSRFGDESLSIGQRVVCVVVKSVVFPQAKLHYRCLTIWVHKYAIL